MKKRYNFTIDELLMEWFRGTSKSEGKKMSRVIEGLLYEHSSSIALSGSAS